MRRGLFVYDIVQIRKVIGCLRVKQAHMVRSVGLVLYVLVGYGLLVCCLFSRATLSTPPAAEAKCRCRADIRSPGRQPKLAPCMAHSL